MSFILYNTTTQKKEGPARADRYTVDGLPGVLPAHLVELEIIDIPFPTTLAENERAERSEVVDLGAKTLTRGWNVVPFTPPVPMAVARQQLFQWLFNAKGVTRAQIRAMIEANPNATERESALIDFEEAANIRRNHPLVGQLAVALGMSPAEVDDGFRAAIKL
jgi:hypothetical protein